MADDRTLCTISTSGDIEIKNGACRVLPLENTKENIENIAYGLDEISQLNPVFFNYKKDSSAASAQSLIDDRTKRRLGFIAEDVQAVIPEVVIWQQPGQVDGIDYAYLTALRVKGIQELDQRTENYETLCLESAPQHQVSNLMCLGIVV